MKNLKMEQGYLGYRDLNVYKLSYQMALEIHNITKYFPTEEKYSLTDQIRRASRSIPANIAEAWKKRRYQKIFASKIIDCAGEAGEVEVWLDFSKDFNKNVEIPVLWTGSEFNYLSQEKYEYFINHYKDINRMLFGIINKPEKFCTST